MNCVVLRGKFDVFSTPWLAFKVYAWYKIEGLFHMCDSLNKALIEMYMIYMDYIELAYVTI